MATDSFDRDKFSRLVHYVICKAGNKPGFGATKLNKVLWFAEARHYMLTGKPITGETYIRQKYGPVPKDIRSVTADLKDRGLIQIFDPKQEYEGRRFRAIGPSPNIDIFSNQEIEAVDSWTKIISEDHTAKSISEESHDYAWEIAKMGEELPLYALRTSLFRDPTDAEMIRIREKVKKLGLN